MIPKVRTTPDLSADSPMHLAVRAEDPKNLDFLKRNVIDEFKQLTNEEIKKRLRDTALPVDVCFESWGYNMNIAASWRSCNAFNVNKIYYIGDKKINRVPAQGTYVYLDIEHVSTIDSFLEIKKKKKFIAIDNVPGAVPIEDYQWQPDSMLIFGSEDCGITPKLLSHCDEVVKISMFGSVRSLNCSVACGIVLYDVAAKLKTRRKTSE
jgi:tRNA G18 (ribose-2'-O)-methylase SpoU